MNSDMPDRALVKQIQQAERLCYGKYRGIVVSNDDPDRLGRLTLCVPKVFGPNVVTGWALPCVPYGGGRNQGFLYIPERNDRVWVEFEGGDTDLPIWTGTIWSNPDGDSELPHPNNADGSEQDLVQRPPTRKIIKTQKGHTIQFEDADQQEMVIFIEATHKHVVTLNKDGIQITDGVNGNKIIMGAQGIQIGSSNAAEPFVLGQQFLANVASFLTALNAHTHTLTVGATLPPVTALQLQVPVSTKHRVE